MTSLIMLAAIFFIVIGALMLGSQSVSQPYPPQSISEHNFRILAEILETKFQNVSEMQGFYKERKVEAKCIYGGSDSGEWIAFELLIKPKVKITFEKLVDLRSKGHRFNSNPEIDVLKDKILFRLTDEKRFLNLSFREDWVAILEELTAVAETYESDS